MLTPEVRKGAWNEPFVEWAGNEFFIIISD
jgi:hypothetical protein